MTPDAPLAMFAALAAAVAAFLVWRLCRRIVRLGYFCLYFAIGFGLSWLGSAIFMQREPSMAVLIGGATGFAWVCSFVRSKIARLVSALFLIAMVRLVGTHAPSFDLRDLTDAVGGAKALTGGPTEHSHPKKSP